MYKPAINLTEEEWRKKLSPEQYKVLREKGTEMPFTGKYAFLREKGTYYCAGCRQPLFSSDTKFDSGSGWPSFSKPISKGAIIQREDYSHGMRRIEIICSMCGCHLGHLFDDGPQPTRLRYCSNSPALIFRKKPK
ncbi:MAG: peptide-methionine (R)-S-oxide reductase MsrB [Candidatus Micrarchaeota archaeon]